MEINYIYIKLITYFYLVFKEILYKHYAICCDPKNPAEKKIETTILKAFNKSNIETKHEQKERITRNKLIALTTLFIKSCKTEKLEKQDTEVRDE